MEKLLGFLVENTHRGALRNILTHLLKVRAASAFWDCVFLMVLIFIGCYLLLFRLRLFFAYQTPKKQKKRRGAKSDRQPKPVAEKKEPNLLAWLYLSESQTFRRYQEKHPKGCKILFVYNGITVSVYLLSALLVLLSLFDDLFRTLFLDLFFVHVYLNVLPKALFDALAWLHHSILSDNSID